jgi:hypothetical protein
VKGLGMGLLQDTISSIMSLPLMAIIGASSSSIDGRRSAMNHFDGFTKHSRETLGSNVPRDFADMTYLDFCQVETMQAFSYFLVNVVLFQGEPLSRQTVLSFLSHVMISGRAKFDDRTGANTVQSAFFAVLDANQNTAPTWYSGLRKTAGGTVLRRCIDKGDPIVESAPAVCRLGVQDACLALLKMDTPDSIVRASVIKTIFLGAGRGGEGSTLSYDLLDWDRTFKACNTKWSQYKTN